jgi:hypothetical protein
VNTAFTPGKRIRKLKKGATWELLNRWKQQKNMNARFSISKNTEASYLKSALVVEKITCLVLFRRVILDLHHYFSNESAKGQTGYGE